MSWERFKNMKEKKCLMVDNYVLYKVLDKLKETIGIEKLGNTEILIVIDDRLPEDIIFKNFVILITYILNGYGKFYPQLFLEEASVL